MADPIILDFSLPSTDQPSRSPSPNLKQRAFTAAEKGKGRAEMRELDPEASENENYATGMEPVEGTIYENYESCSRELEYFKFPIRLSSKVVGKDGTRSFYFKCCYRGSKSVCGWRLGGRETSLLGPVKIYILNSEHSHKLPSLAARPNRAESTVRKAVLKNGREKRKETIVEINDSSRKRRASSLQSPDRTPGSVPDSPLPTNSNQAPEEKNQHKKSRIFGLDTPPPPPSTFPSDSNRVPPGSAPRVPLAAPMPNISIEIPTSSPEWIAELTILITAIDPRLGHLCLVFDNAGVKNERAVKEMLNFSEEGLIRLTEKLMIPVAGMPIMTIMQGIWFKKGVKKIREGTA